MVDLLIPGPEGKIEAKYTHSNNDKSPIVLILHPDPSRGGTMNTKIIFKLYKMFVNNGFSAIRFNFRGVGKSDGIYDDGEGELSDAASVLDWLQQYNTNSKVCWVAGFSFGAWVAMQLLMRRPANLRDFSFLAPCPSSGLIVHGDKDNIASFDSTKILAEKLQKQKKVEIKFKAIKGADHFYENYSEEFVSTVDGYIKENLKKI